jgi:hypothetical protein
VHVYARLRTASAATSPQNGPWRYARQSGSGGATNRYSLELNPDLSACPPSDLAAAYGSCLLKRQFEPIRK